MAKYKIVKLKKGKKSVRKITSKDQMYDNLINMQYDPKIAEELSGIWAEHVNRAYKKGVQDSKIKDKITDIVKGIKGGFIDFEGDQETCWMQDLENSTGPSVSTQEEVSKGTFIQGLGSVNRCITDGFTPKGAISYDRYLSEKEIETNGEETKIHTHIFCPVPLRQFIENLHPTIRMKGNVLIIDTVGNYYNETITYIHENLYNDLPNEFICTKSDKFSTRTASCYMDGIEVTVVDAREKTLFIGKELAQWQ